MSNFRQWPINKNYSMSNFRDTRRGASGAGRAEKDVEKQNLS
jgi:hypothetical protein